ncbi:complex I NDUFA9 subunit family protein [Planctomycetota bacterium]|nr:complex I NDUFA9 subunit family protein [Planctomycetota bacterium]
MRQVEKMGDSSTQIALTGSTGFVGSHILRNLFERNYTVRTLVRTTRPTIMTQISSDSNPLSTTSHEAATPEKTIVEDRSHEGDAECPVGADQEEKPIGSIPDTEQGNPNPFNADDHDTKEIEGDLFNNGSLEKLVEGADVVVHLVGIIREYPRRGQTFGRIHVEGTKRLLVAAKKAGVRRWIQMSALGTRANAKSAYHRTKYEAERAVIESGLDWTIFRPSLIHGSDGEFMRMVKDMVSRDVIKGGLPFVPFFAKGGVFGRSYGGKVQPVWVEDVAKVFVDAIENEKTIGEIYEVAGPDRLTWPELYGICERHMSGAKSRKAIGVPSWLAKGVAQVAEGVGITGLPFGSDQVVMAGEDNVASDKGLVQLDVDFGLKRQGFEQLVGKYGPRMT